MLFRAIGCDSCMKVAVVGARNICIECSAKDWINASVDICSQCVRICLDRSSSISGHDLSHHLLQLRMVTHRRKQYSLCQAARAIIDPIEGKDSSDNEMTSESELIHAVSQRKLYCVGCRGLVATPFWYCIECECEYFLKPLLSIL